MTDLTNEERQMVAEAVRPMYLGTEAWAVIAHIKAEAGQAAVREYLERHDAPRIVVDLANDESQWYLDATVKAAKAAALREAAGELDWVRPDAVPCDDPEGCCGSAGSCDLMQPTTKVVGAAWLRDRADRIEAER